MRHCRQSISVRNILRKPCFWAADRILRMFSLPMSYFLSNIQFFTNAYCQYDVVMRFIMWDSCSCWRGYSIKYAITSMMITTNQLRSVIANTLIVNDFLHYFFELFELILFFLLKFCFHNRGWWIIK